MGPADLPALLAGPASVVPEDGLREKLELGRPLRVKLGLDPTAPAVTLGWAVVLRKLRQFQDAGHVAVLIVGDFTARVGDPSGKTETRPRLSKEEVRGHAESLLDQFWAILDPDKTEVRYNAEWLEPLDMEGVLRLTASYTVARMLERDDFAKRYAEGQPISMMEFLYPLMQGYDSVAVQADVELGGTDQLFNLLVGRDLQREYGQEPQVALTMPLLVGTDGVQKMSQSLGNYVGITEPADEMFGKLTRVPDELIPEYRRLALDFFRDPAEADRVASGLAGGRLEPWEEKKRMAREVVDLYHGDGSGRLAETEFGRVHKGGELPPEIRDVVVPRSALIVRKKPGVEVLDFAALLTELGLTETRSEARRLVEQGGVKRDGLALRDPEVRVEVPGRTAEGELQALEGTVWQVGRRRFARVAGLR
jgi:tyrosyl-tRNA synthetase